MTESEGYIIPEEVLGFEYTPTKFTYTERDVSLYALGIGAAQNALDKSELQFVYEQNPEGFKTLPTFGVLYPHFHQPIPGIKFKVENGLHGEEYLEIKKPLPTSGTITCTGKIIGVYDKGSGAVIVTQSISHDENGAELARHEHTVFIRGIGGFGGDRGPSSKINIPPDRAPDKVHSEKIADNQALIYRLSGDFNPLHADPEVAVRGNFARPILHGLCTYGFAGRALLKHYCDNDPARFKSIKARFVSPVLPGETLITEMWKLNATTVIFQSKVAERDELVLANAAVEIDS